MSFFRWVYWSGLLGGWSAFVGWFFSELLVGRWIETNSFAAVAMACMVAAAVGAGLVAASSLTNIQLPSFLLRLGVGLAGGFLAGLIGSALGNGFYALIGRNYLLLDFIGRVMGWTMMGLFLGAAQGVFELSPRKMINGAIGGTIGGFLGGFLFNPLSALIGSPMSSRAIGFVILGLFIGFAVGLVRVILRDAWITVEQGFRPNRQLLLDQPVTTMGTSERASLIFIAYGAKGVEPLHLEIRKRKEGGFEVIDNKSRTGTFVNTQRVTEPTLLRDDDRIQFGANVIRFQWRGRAESKKGPPERPRAAPEKPPMAKIAASGVVFTPVASQPSASPPNARKVTPVQTAAATPKPSVESSPPTVEIAPCPVCGHKNKGIPNKRRCESCFNVY